MKKLVMATLFGLSVLASPAAAEIELSLYMGAQTSPHSRISGDIAGTPVSKLIGWQGKSTSPPPYYGMRATWWRNNDWGFGMEFTHAKAYAPAAEMAPEFSRLEFTDGHNIITVNVHRRWQNKWMNGRVTPYVSAGIGIAMPHVDIQPTYQGAPHTFGYQVTGPAAKLGIGASYSVTDHWRVFGEYQFTYSDNTVSLDGGGTLQARILTNALNFGIAYGF